VDILVKHVLGAVAARGHGAAVGALEEPAVPVIFLDAEAAFMHQPMIASAEQQQVPEGGAPLSNA
jgi:hypothetical protein